MAFKDIFYFDVCKALAAGEQVWVLDKQEHSIIDANETSAEHLMGILRGAETDKTNRWAFWKEEKA